MSSKESELGKIFDNIKEGRSPSSSKKSTESITPRKPTRSIIKKKKKDVLTCGQCQKTSDKDSTIKKRRFKYADGSDAEDSLCDECFESLVEPDEAESSEIEKAESIPEDESPEQEPHKTNLEELKTSEEEKLEEKILPEEKEVVEPVEHKDETNEKDEKKKKRPPRPPRSRKRKATTEKKEKGVDVKETTKLEEKKPQPRVIKPDKSKREVVKAGIISEDKLKKILGQDQIDFEDPFKAEELIVTQTIVIVGKGKRGKSTLALSVVRGMFDRDNAPSDYDNKKKVFEKCGHKKPTHGCQNCRATVIYAITMDDKTQKPAKDARSEHKIIHVIRGMEHYREGTDALRLLTSHLTQKYVDNLLLKWIPEHCEKNYKIPKPDFVLIDDLQILQNVYNHAMRESFGFGVYDKFDWKHWTRRNQFVNETHRLANTLSKEALIYCTYEKWQDKEKEDGSTVSIKMPAWAGDIEKKTDTLIEVFYHEGDKMAFLAQVKSAKDVYWSYRKDKVTTDYKGHGGLWNLLQNAPKGKQYDMNVEKI